MMATLFGGDDAQAARSRDRASADEYPTLGDGMSTATLELDGQSAVADRASELRVALGNWLQSHGVSADKAYDIVLATYEAIANSVEHAYRNIAGGTFDLRARFFQDEGRVEVIVADHGSWSTHDADPHRGRGVPLMRALADAADVISNDAGTTVRLVWDSAR